MNRAWGASEYSHVQDIYLYNPTHEPRKALRTKAKSPKSVQVDPTVCKNEVKIEEKNGVVLMGFPLRYFFLA